MSDFEADLNQKHGALLVEAMALDFVMWNAKNHKTRRPWVLLSGDSAPPYYGGLPNYASKDDLEDQARQVEAELVDRVYWQGKPMPCRRPPRRPESMSLLYGDVERGHVSSEVRELADRLHISEKHVRRKLAALLKVGKIPANWRIGKQWRPAVNQAEKALLAAGGKSHKPHTRAADNAYAGYLVQCRRDAGKLKDELREIHGNLEVCKTWIRLTRESGLSSVDSDKARAQAFTVLNQLVEKRRWSFCKLFVGIYAALLNGSHMPVVEAKKFLGLNHSAFYRIYTKKEVREALKIAAQIQANPNWMGYAPQLEDKGDDTSAAFSDWGGKVPDAELWASSKG